LKRLPRDWPPNNTIGRRETELQLAKKTVILRVCANPEPGDLLVLQKREGTVSEGHSHRVDMVPIVNPLEVEAWMPGVLAEKPIRVPSEFPNLRW
jgi:hypothetical protein